MFRKGSSSAFRRVLWVSMSCLWLGIGAIGLTLLAWHENTPGTSSTSPSKWPPGSQIDLSDRGSTLVMFAHPQCPCTRASLGELEKIVARYPTKIETWVVFLKPMNADKSWTTTDQVATALALPNVKVLFDLDGTEANRYGATTSGQTLLFDHGGNLQFSGGITFARGHAGDNPGRCAIESLLSGATSDRRTSPVFGCSLQTPSSSN